MTQCRCDRRGSIHLIVGPMFSGKSTELFRLIKRHSLAGKSTIVVKYASDDRYDETLACTHDLQKVEAVSAVNLWDVFDQLAAHQVTGIDEGQFFGDIVECAEKLANMGKTVVVAALDGDFRREPFGNIARLIAKAEKVDKIHAICNACGHHASFTIRTVDSAERVIIGGAETYRAVCRECYHKTLAAEGKLATPTPDKDNTVSD